MATIFMKKKPAKSPQKVGKGKEWRSGESHKMFKEGKKHEKWAAGKWAAGKWAKGK